MPRQSGAAGIGAARAGCDADRLKASLAAGRSPDLVYQSIDLSLYGARLPPGIRSSWVFALRGNTVSGAERHPDSIQRMMSYRGSGDLQTKLAEGGSRTIW